jgi:hypothetical protein
VELRDNNSYAAKGLRKASIKMKSGNNVHLNNVLYVPGLKKNLVSISCLEDKGDRIVFVDGKVLVWSKDSKIEDARVIEFREGRLYKLLGQNAQALVHDELNPSMKVCSPSLSSIATSKIDGCRHTRTTISTRKCLQKKCTWEEY